MPLLKEIIMPFAPSTPWTPEQQAHAEAVQAKHNASWAQQTILLVLTLAGVFLLFRQR